MLVGAYIFVCVDTCILNSKKLENSNGLSCNKFHVLIFYMSLTFDNRLNIVLYLNVFISNRWIHTILSFRTLQDVYLCVGVDNQWCNCSTNNYLTLALPFSVDFPLTDLSRINCNTYIFINHLEFEGKSQQLTYLTLLQIIPMSKLY